MFIVHGHDRAPKAEVARFIEKLGFQAIILHERPNKGRTIITKFREEAADVGFAIILMTPDEITVENLGKPLIPEHARTSYLSWAFLLALSALST